MKPDLYVSHSTEYPMLDKPNEEQWWIGIKNWNRFSESAKRRFIEFRKRRKPCRVIWFFGRTTPSIEEINP